MGLSVKNLPQASIREMGMLYSPDLSTASAQMKETDNKKKSGKRKTRDDDDNEPEEAIRRGVSRGSKRGGRR